MSKEYNSSIEKYMQTIEFKILNYSLVLKLYYPSKVRRCCYPSRRGTTFFCNFFYLTSFYGHHSHLIRLDHIINDDFSLETISFLKLLVLNCRNVQPAANV